MSKHLPIGGSTAARTLACPAWLARAKRLPKPPSNKYADEGNLLHDAMENHYRDDTPFADMVGVLQFQGITLTEEHVTELLTPARQALEDLLDVHDIEHLFFEPFVEIVPDYAGGSIDVLGVSSDGKTALIADYKFGQKGVDVEDNAQLQFYALAATLDKKTAPHLKHCTQVVYAIIQPKLRAQAQQWQQDKQKLEVFHNELKAALEQPDKALPGKHCEYCPAAPVCEERKHQARAALLLDTATSNEVAEALVLALDLEVWVKQVKDQAETLALSGAALPGFKLVRGKSQRRYTAKAEEGGLVELLKDKAFTRKLIPVTEAEKQLGKGVLEEKGLVEKPDGKLTLAPESDKREAVLPVSNENLKLFVDKISTKK